MSSHPSDSALGPLASTHKVLAIQPVVESKVSSFATVPAIEIYSPAFYYTCAVGGSFACGLTHAILTPVDLVKCRLQVNPTLYNGTRDALVKIGKAEGLSGLYTGLGATAIGYSMQGACKYGFYELFKKKYSDAAGEENAFRYRTALYLGASASSEFIADIALCPMEAVKVRMQTSATPFASGAMDGFRKIVATEGVNGLFKGLTPLWMRQIPYTMMKFASFETIVEAIYSNALSRPKNEYSKPQQLGVSLVGGYAAGVLCAVVSHPADTLVSKLNNVSKDGSESTTTFLMRTLRDLGFKGAWRGLGTRIAMIGALTSLQWTIYDTFKVYTGLPTTGVSVPKQ